MAYLSCAQAIAISVFSPHTTTDTEIISEVPVIQQHHYRKQRLHVPGTCHLLVKALSRAYFTIRCSTQKP